MWFVPAPNATREDNGVLLTPVMDGQKRQSYLLLLNATTMTTINRAYLPSLVPFTIHGRFFPDLV
jgi:carotenoid cleavage dioxygenase-like enzyme